MSPYIEVGWVRCILLILNLQKGHVFSPLILCSYSIAQLHACNLQNIHLQGETWSCTRVWTSIYDFRKKLTLQKAWEEVWTLVGKTVLYPLPFQIHTLESTGLWKVFCVVQTIIPYFSLAHLCPWTSTITFIYSSGTRRPSEVYKICLVCCGQSPLFFMVSACQDTERHKELIL